MPCQQFEVWQLRGKLHQPKQPHDDQEDEATPLNFTKDRNRAELHPMIFQATASCADDSCV